MATCIVNTGNSAGVNVRTSKDTESKKLGVIDNGVSVDVVRCNDTWATLMYNSTPAFVQHKYLQNPPSTNGDGLSVNANATCNGNSVNVRNAANGNTVVKQINKGASYKVLGKSLTGGYYWYQIGTNQWVRGDYLTPNASGSSGGSVNSYTVGKYGATNTGAVFVRKSAGGTKYSTTEKLRQGSTFLIAGTSGSGSNTWVKVRYGTASGGNTDAYISATYFDELATAPSNSAKERCVKIATSLAGVHETVLGLSGDCCQQFIYWLCGACGKIVNNMPYGKDKCGEARDYFKVSGQGTWHPLNSGYVPQSGDLVYYTSGTTDASSHVGLVTGSGSNSFATTGYTSIECNLSDRVKACKGNYQTGACDNNKTVQGFATPLWT